MIFLNDMKGILKEIGRFAYRAAVDMPSLGQLVEVGVLKKTKSKARRGRGPPAGWHRHPRGGLQEVASVL